MRWNIASRLQFDGIKRSTAWETKKTGADQNNRIRISVRDGCLRKNRAAVLFMLMRENAGYLYDLGYKKLTRILHSGGNRFYTGSVFF